MDSIVDQIVALQLEIANLKRAAGRLIKLEKQHQTEQAGLVKLEQKVEKEYRDILALRKKGLIDLFLDQQEEKDRKMEKEQQEYHAAVVALKRAEHAVKMLEFEINILREKAAKLPDQEFLLQQLKSRKKRSVELKTKRENDKTTVIKNRLRIAFHKLVQSGQKIQVYLQEIENSLHKIETWQNWNQPQSEKESIFRQEFAVIEKALHEQNTELVHFNAALQNLPDAEKFINAADRKGLEKIETECSDLKEKLASFAESTLNDPANKGHLQNELTKLKAKIVEIQYEIDQATKFLPL